MNATTSVYLNLMRFLAAVTVLLCHAGEKQISGGLFWQIGRYGQDAVSVFFVLSGFVIAYVTHQRETDAGTYALQRAARIYSVAVPALLLTFALDSVSCHYGSAWMVAQCVNYHSAIPFPLGLAFLGEVWNVHLAPGTNGSYWSLGFEVPYYLMFGVFRFVPRPWNWIATTLLLLVFGPKIASMFIVWLTGFACYRLCIRFSSRHHSRAGLVLWLGSTAALVVIAGPTGIDKIFAPFTMTSANLLSHLHYLTLGVLVAANIFGLYLSSNLLAPVANRVGRQIGWLAGATFSIYLFHLPLLDFVATVSPWPVESWPTRALVYIGVPAVMFALAEVTERRKDLWKNGMLAIATRFRPTSP
jgi:peptidoglycan/LPS O-acetylase OafA/YrhL